MSSNLPLRSLALQEVNFSSYALYGLNCLANQIPLPRGSNRRLARCRSISCNACHPPSRRGRHLTCDCRTRSLATTPHLRLRRLTCDCRDRKLTCDCRVRYNVTAWGGGGGNASGGHCGEGCRVGGQHERSHLPRGNALGQRGGEQQRRKQWRQRNTHFESRVTCWRCAKDSTAWLASLWRFFPPLCASS